jgi:uncharacterized protein YkwD
MWQQPYGPFMRVLGLSLALCAAALGDILTAQAHDAPAVRPEIATLVALVNQERHQAGSAPLTIDATLMAAAQTQAQYMAVQRAMGHQGHRGTTPAQRVAQQGYRASRVGENIARGQTTPAAVLQSWMQSPPHRHNILGHFSAVGAARATDADGTPYWCMVFGLPQP